MPQISDLIMVAAREGHSSSVADYSGHCGSYACCALATTATTNGGTLSRTRSRLVMRVPAAGHHHH